MRLPVKRTYVKVRVEENLFGLPIAPDAWVRPDMGHPSGESMRVPDFLTYRSSRSEIKITLMSLTLVPLGPVTRSASAALRAA
jgi:hypothetical protein